MGPAIGIALAAALTMPLAAAAVTLADELRVRGHSRGHALLEITALGGLCRLAGNDQPHACLPRRVDSQMRALLGGQAAQEKNEVVLILTVRVLLEFNAVRNGRNPWQVGCGTPLEFRDRDEW
jgi:hypothetical protein